MRQPIQIGSNEFDSKKEALEFYKQILNSYDFGQNVSENDFNELIELLKNREDSKSKIGIGIEKIRITKVKFNTKCFEIIRKDNSTETFSYRKGIKAPTKKSTKFLAACRQVVQEDLRNVKLSYFKANSKNGKVKCQETGELLPWENLHVDHRQPNTFSVIVDRFIEVNQINIDKISYIKINGSADKFTDNKLAERFREYHKEKANLRLVNKELNLGRTYQARIKRQKKDLNIE